MYYLDTGLLFLLLISTNTFGLVENQKLWREPGAWSNVKISQNDIIDESISQQECKCPIFEECKAGDNNQLSAIYYKKLLHLLFSTDNYNENEDGTYTRTLKLTLSSEQINILKNSKDPRDWDEIVSNVFRIAEPIKLFKLMSNDNFIITAFKGMKTNIMNFILMPEFTFLWYTVAFICVIIIMNKKYNYGIIGIFLILCFLSGFAYTYYDCNKQLEIEELAELLHSEGTDPCQNIQSENNGWSVWGFFSRKSTREQCIEHLKKKHKTKLPFCRPDDVFLTYVNEIILDQFQRTVEKCTNIFKITLEKVPFPYNLVAVTLFGLMLPLFLKMIFQHVIDPRVWFHKPSNSIPTAQTPIVVENNDNSLLLNRLILEKLEYHQKKTDAKLLNLERNISGVQILTVTEDIQIQNSLEPIKSDGEILNTTEVTEITKRKNSENSSTVEHNDHSQSKNLDDLNTT